jgi:KDO2-lipid IV(A) lauroyltransferase
MDTSSGDVGVVTQALADRFAAGIAAHPADWHMLQPQWLADLSDERRARLASGAERSDGGKMSSGAERSDGGKMLGDNS